MPRSSTAKYNTVGGKFEGQPTVLCRETREVGSMAFDDCDLIMQYAGFVFFDSVIVIRALFLVQGCRARVGGREAVQ